MNYNLFTYAVYLILMVGVIYYIGKVCYTNGRAFIFNVVQDHNLTDRTNKLLLAGYYLINIGFVIVTISGWPKITSPVDIIHALSKHIGFLLFLLATLHYFNIYFITHLFNKLFNS